MAQKQQLIHKDAPIGVGFNSGLVPLYNAALGSDLPSNIANPIVIGTNRMYFWGGIVLHVSVWFLGTVFSSIANFNAKTEMGNSTTPEYSEDGMSASTEMIGIAGSTSTIIGFLALALAIAITTAEEYKTMPWINMGIQLFLAYGTVASFFVFIEYARHTENSFFVMSLMGVLLLGYGQVLIHCTASALNVQGNEYVLLPCVAFAFQTITAVCVRDDTYKCNNKDCGTMQDTLAFLAPMCTLLAIALSVTVTSVFGGIKPLPFMRSYVMFAFLLAAIFTEYIATLVTASDHVSAAIFTNASTFFSFVTFIGYLLV